MLDLYDPERAWMQWGACGSADPDAWFPTTGVPATVAKQVCNGRKGRPPCPVRDRCLAWALDRDEDFGVWGGKSERERRKLKKKSTTA
jgi:WhiB family redox-sensing transcriptional regulator